MIAPKNQNWRVSSDPFSLSLANVVSTGTSYTTPSNATENSKIFASAGFRGFGPMLTFPGGAGMDGLSGCGCGCGNNGGSLQQLVMLALAGVGVYFLITAFSRRGYYD